MKPLAVVATSFFAMKFLFSSRRKSKSNHNQVEVSWYRFGRSRDFAGWCVALWVLCDPSDRCGCLHGVALLGVAVVWVLWFFLVLWLAGCCGSLFFYFIFILFRLPDAVLFSGCCGFLGKRYCTSSGGKREHNHGHSGRVESL